MRILVIGGTGFIGPHLVRQLAAAGHQVTVFHRGNGKLDLPAREILGRRADLGDLKLEADVVVDLILSSGAQAQETMDAFRGRAARVVAASSMDVYRAYGILRGMEDGPLQPAPLTEDSELRTTLHPYPPAVIEQLQKVAGWLDDDYDKIPVEQTILSDRELPGTVLRLPMIYGPGDRQRRFGAILKPMFEGRDEILFEESVAAWFPPRGYVVNVAAALALAAADQRAAGRIYNVAERPGFSELAWARKIAEAFGWRGEFIVLPKDRAPADLLPPGNMAQQLEADSSRIRGELGYAEPFSIEESIRRTIEFERAAHLQTTGN